MNKVLITGASGFVGKNLLSFLRNTHYLVETLSLRNPDWENNSISANVIVNLVGKAHDHKGQATEADFMESNLGLTRRLFDVFLKSDASLFIHISSIAALEEENALAVVTEDYIPNPKSFYGHSKKMAEEYLLSQALPQNKKMIILRPTMIHGPGDKGNLVLLFKIINKGIPYPLGAFDNERSFIGVDNLCYVIERIINSRHTIISGAYNVADDESLSTLQIINTIGKITNKKALVLKIPVVIIKFLAKAGDYLKLPLNSKRLTKMTSTMIVSNSKIKEALSIEKLPLSAQESLDRTIKSFIS